MPVRYRGHVSYETFEQRVRRHRPSQLVPAIAALTAKQEARQIEPPQERLLLPWALAAAAKESLRAGNEFRQTGVSIDDLREIAAAYNAIDEPLNDGSELGRLHAFFTRIAYEQFPYQHSKFQEITRPYALLKLCSERVETRILNDDFWKRALGCSLQEFWASAFFLSVAAERNNGVVTLDLMSQDDIQPAFKEVSAETIESVLRTQLSSTRDAFREEANLFRSDDPRLRRYDFNPLIAKPFIEWDEGRYLAPVSHLVLRRVSTLGMYFAGLAACTTRGETENFTQDIGELFQAYVGRQLEDMVGASAIPEIHYEGKRSVDWFLAFDDLTVLIEAKSTRLTQDARMGKPALEADVNRTVGKAFEQIAATHDRIVEGHPAFAHIPADRPIHGLVVTLEPYFLVNNPLMRTLLPNPGMPVTAVSSRELEYLVTLSPELAISEFLLETMTDEERSSWDFSASLGDRRSSRHNPFLAEAWSYFPWHGLAEVDTGGDVSRGPTA